MKKKSVVFFLLEDLAYEDNWILESVALFQVDANSLVLHRDIVGSKVFCWVSLIIGYPSLLYAVCCQATIIHLPVMLSSKNNVSWNERDYLSSLLSCALLGFHAWATVDWPIGGHKRAESSSEELRAWLPTKKEFPDAES